MSEVKLSKAWDQEHVPETNDTELGRIDEAMIVIKQIKRRRMKMIKEIEKRTSVTENQKIYIAQEYDLWRQIETLVKQVDANIKYTLGRIPPHAPEMEEAVVGAVILESRATAHSSPAIDYVRPFLLPEHFYDDRLKRLYMACLSIKGPIDMRTVVDYLRRTGELEVVGNSYYIAELTAKVSSAANIEYHARVIVEHAMRRAMIQGASFVIENSYEDSRDIFGLIGYAKKALRRVEGWIK